MKQVAVRYSQGVVKIPVAQRSMAEGEIPKWAVAFNEKLAQLDNANKFIGELQNEVLQLRIALDHVLRSPEGVVPKEADHLYDRERASFITEEYHKMLMEKKHAQ